MDEVWGLQVELLSPLVLPQVVLWLVYNLHTRLKLTKVNRVRPSMKDFMENVPLAEPSVHAVTFRVWFRAHGWPRELGVRQTVGLDFHTWHFESQHALVVLHVVP